MNRQYLRPYGVQTIHKFQSEYTITTQIGLGGQATVYNVQSITPTTTNPTTSSSKCVKLFKIDMTDFKKSIKKFYQIINLYYIISSNNLSDYFHIYGNCDPSNSKWTGLIILMKKYHHTLSDTKYWLKTSQIQTTSTQTDSNNNMNACAEGQTLLPQMDKITIENDLMNKGYMIGDNWRFIQKLCTDLLSHLDTMHSANIIHNDIKPDNIVFDIDDNKWKLIDFDLSMKVERDGREGVILHNKYRGSPYYSAPEVPINSNKNRQCVFSKAGDIWSLGMVISWCILKRNHIWFFINCVLENGKKK
eukprot:989232_1